MTRRLLTPLDFHRLGPDLELVTIREAADQIGEHPKLVREWVQHGHVPYTVVAGRIMVPMSLVAARERDARHHVRRLGGRPRRRSPRGMV